MGTREEAERKKQEAHEKARRSRDLEDVRYLLSRPEFRRFVGRLVNLCGLMVGGFNGSAEVHFSEGKRWIALKLIEEITEADPDAYPKMLIELRTQEGA